MLSRPACPQTLTPLQLRAPTVLGQALNLEENVNFVKLGTGSAEQSCNTETIIGSNLHPNPMYCEIHYGFLTESDL